MKKYLVSAVILFVLVTVVGFNFGFWFESKRERFVTSWHISRDSIIELFGTPDTLYSERFYSEADSVKEEDLFSDGECFGYFFWIGKMKTFCFLSDTLASFGVEERCFSCD